MNRKYDISTEELIKYRLEGHSTAETAMHFNMPKNTVKSRLVHLNIGKQTSQFSNTPEEKVREDLKKRNQFLEYTGGYVDSASRMNVRCTLCGTEFTMHAVTIRSKGKTECPTCSLAKVNDVLRVDTFMRHWSSERMHNRADRPKLIRHKHKCLVCGEMTVRPKYCSSRCANSVSNVKHELRRRRFLKEKVVDEDITLGKLFDRDKGTCWICGMPCDYKDYSYKGRYFVAGNLYPSIDHIVPRCKGGVHSWENIKLAHRICNTARYGWTRKDDTQKHIAV